MQAKSGKPPVKPGRVSLPLITTPPKGQPFAGATGLSAPARNTKLPDLTARVEIAKTKKAALTHGGLLTPAQQKAASDAGKALAAHKAVKQAAQAKIPDKLPPIRALASAKTTVKAPRSQAPLVLGAPPAPPVAQAARRVPALGSSPSPPPESRGAHPSQPNRNFTPKTGGGSLIGSIGNATSVGLGTALSVASSVPRVLETPIHPGATHTAVEDVKPTHLEPAARDATTRLAAASNAASAKLASIGTSVHVPKGFKIPSIDVVPPAGAAVKGPITVDEFKQLAKQGAYLTPRLRKKFTAMALKNGHTGAELDGMSDADRIDAAFTNPAVLPLRVLGHLAGGVAQLGTLPAGVEGAVRETAAGHGTEVAKALGQGLYSELPVIGKHPFSDSLVADPFGTVTQFAGAGKIVGEAGRIGRAEGALRDVETASSGLKVNRGNLSKNAYTATGQLIADKAASSIPRVGAHVEKGVIDKTVRTITNKHSRAFKDLQIPYRDAQKKVGPKRAETLLAYQQAGGKPEQIAAFYRAHGEQGPAKFFDNVATTTRTLTDDDHALLNTHAALAAHTSATKIESGKFGQTAATFRRYSQLIRSGAHAGDPDAQRILALRDEYQNHAGNLTDDEHAALEGAYSHAVDQFAGQHVAKGGLEPAYVAYTKPKPLIKPRFTPSAGGPVAFKDATARQKAETGASFESGKYLIDSNSPLLDSARAQREHLASTLKQSVVEQIGQAARGGDIVPPGMVFTNNTNLRSIRRTISDMEDNPVSATDYYDEDHGFRQALHDAVSKNVTPTGHRVPKGESGHFIPKASQDRIEDYTRPPSRSAYNRFLSQYQRALISYRPSTFVNNAVGSMPLAALGGAGPKSFKLAADAMRDSTLGPAVLRGHGLAGSFAKSSESKVGDAMDFMRLQSQRGEDFSRLAAFFSKAGPHIKKQAKALNMSADEYQRAFVAGRIDEPKLNEFLDHTEKFMSDLIKPDSPISRKVGNMIMFHRWVGHIAKLILVTLPVNHPRRLVLLQDLAKYGDQYRQQHGVWPDWYSEYLPLFQHVERIGHNGKPQAFEKTFSTSGINPFSTLNNLAQPVSTNESAKNILLGVANPLLSIPISAAVNRPSDSKSPWLYMAAQTARSIPGVSVVSPQSGMTSDSIPFVRERQKTYAGTRKGEHLPYEFRPTARPQGGILGAALRYGLGGVYDVPAAGPIQNIARKKQIGADEARKRHGG